MYSPIETFKSRFSAKEQKKKHMRTVPEHQGRFRKLTMEQCEDRLPLSTVTGQDAPALEQTTDTAALIGKALYSDTFDDSATAAAFWNMAESDINVSNGELVLGMNKLYTNERELPPSPENPLVVKFDFKIPGNGVKVLTR
ncbi:hypothetical protein KKF55_00340, partial [Patescibacteria group bacterium]|nr:hypothetical protein [Patescibacteria group bacterium]